MSTELPHDAVWRRLASSVCAKLLESLTFETTSARRSLSKHTAWGFVAQWTLFMIHSELPEYDFSLVIRTDFTDDSKWQRICQLLKEPQSPYGFQASVECISDRSCSGLRPEDVRSVLPPDCARPFVFLVDSEAVLHPDHPVLVVDLSAEPARTFRVIPSEAWGVENNLRLANMDFADFAEAVDDQAVFRGFPGAPL